jgi:hypothetical protein
MRRYIILYRTKTGLKRIKMIQALDVSEATMLGIKFCLKMGRSFYALDCVSN